MYASTLLVLEAGNAALAHATIAPARKAAQLRSALKASVSPSRARDSRRNFHRGRALRSGGVFMSLRWASVIARAISKLPDLVHSP